MRKKILAAIVAAAMTDRKLAGGKKLNNKGKTDSLKKTEEVAEEIVAEKVVTEEDVQEDTIEKTIIEQNINEENINEEDINEEKIYEQVVTTDQPIIDEIITEEKTVEIHNEFAYEFEGKYWLRYSAYGHLGWYFDGSRAISQAENQGIYARDYFVEGGLLNIGGEYYRYELLDGKLGLALARDESGYYAYYEEVDKGEYDSLFN
ncbi:MAG: hypothetical protein IIW92_08470 [Lachnospiraceae bacterium]|nr:hypothetical protein [Lachnospiraceae bacterium]